MPQHQLREEKGEGARDPLLWLQRVKRLLIAYHNHNRNRNCGEGGEMWGIKNLEEEHEER